MTADDSATAYAELHCLTNFTFLRGASHAEELIVRAHELGYRALAITDECSVAGVVRAHTAAKKCGLPIIVGSELRLECGLRFVALATNRAAYGSLCRLITRGRRSAAKGQYLLKRADVEALLSGCQILWLPADDPVASECEWLIELFPGAVHLAVELMLKGRDNEVLYSLRRLAGKLRIPAVAAGDVHMHVRSRRQLQDVVTAIRHRVSVAEAGWRLYQNGERHLRPLQSLKRIYPAELLNESVRIAERCAFSLDELRYEYPREIVPHGETPASYLRRMTEEGALRRWPQGVPGKIRPMIEHELSLIAELRYEPYFLTVYDIVAFARSRGILCQGRGSAANSVVCYCLGITEVDPARMSTLVERFISRERNEPPDIDIDFEHERREEVIQYIYNKYGRERAALAATVISYQPRSALRDVARCFDLDPVQASRLSGAMQWWDGVVIDPKRIWEAGFDPKSAPVRRVLHFAAELLRFPRHLSQHVGGFVISQGPLEELVPIENAAMPDRTVIQWDKDDLDDLGLIKVDVLGLGMLTAIRRALALVSSLRARPVRMQDIPAEDPVVYDMICRADTVGVFQIESRAQMGMLPRLKPRCFYDLVIEVAIVRPGPIQGDMVHPYLRRRKGDEPVTYPSDEVRDVLARTLGVPLFQEQVMQLAIVAAGFTPGEADRLRRAMAAWKKRGGLDPFEERLMNGMRERGYSEEFAQRIFQQILGFGDYGFPESHSASFALLVYVSSWLKCHEPAAFTCALLNSLPMGFYAPAQLIIDVQRHGVDVRPIDAQYSDYESTLERRANGEPALRLGMHLVKSMKQAAADRIVVARRDNPFTSVQDLTERAGLDRGDLEALASANALESLSGHRHRAFWDVAGTERPLPLIPLGKMSAEDAEGQPMLRAPTEGQSIVADYCSTGLTLGRHPVSLLRDKLAREGCITASELAASRDGADVRCAGIVVTRQRPGSANGVTFVTLEDETGSVQLVVWEKVGEEFRRVLIESHLLEVWGRLQSQDGVQHVIARRLRNRSALLADLVTKPRDFR
jgi:error-prone DNA polymerase